MTSLGKGIGPPWSQSGGAGGFPGAVPDRTLYSTSNAPIKGSKPRNPNAGGGGHGGGNSGGGKGRGRGRDAFGNLEIRSVRAAIRTTAGTQDFTVPGFGTPIACVVMCATGNLDGVARNNQDFSYGASDGTNQFVISGSSIHGVSNGTADRRSATDEIYMIVNSAGSVVAEANFDSFITDGVRLNIAVANIGRLVTVVLIRGDGVTVNVGTHAMSNAAVSTVTTGLETRALICMHISKLFDDTGSTNCAIGFGVAGYDGTTITQHSYMHRTREGPATAECLMQVDNTVFTHENGTITASVQNITDTSFDMNPGAGDGSTHAIGYIAFGGVEAIATMETLPLTTGAHRFAGVGFKPTFAMLGMTMMTALATQTADATAGVHGISVITETEQFSHSLAEEDAETTTDNQGVSDDKAVNLDEDDGTDGYEADFKKFSNDGMTLDFTILTGLPAATASLWPCLWMR